MGTILVRPDGSTIEAADEDVNVLLKAGFRQETTDSARERNAAIAHEDYYSSTGQKVVTALEGFNSGLSLGLTDVASRAVYSDEYNEDKQARAEVNPITHTIGEVGGGIFGSVPMGGASPTGLLTKGAASVGERFAGRTAGRLAEGGVLGVGGAFEQANVTGDPLTIEAAIEGAGMGALLNLGAGFLGDRIRKTAASVKEERLLVTQLEKEAEQAALAGKLLKEPPSTWNEVVESHATVQKHTQKLNKKLLDQAEDYADDITPDAIRSKLGELKTARNEVTVRIGDTTHGQAVAEGTKKATAMDRAYKRDVERASDFWNSTKKYPRVLEQYKEALEDLAVSKGVRSKASAEATTFEEAVDDAARAAERFGDRKAFISSVYEQLPHKWKPNTLDDFKTALNEAHQAGGVQLTRADLVAAMDPALVAASSTKRANAEFHFVTFDPAKTRAVATHPMAEEFAAYNEQLSRAMKARVGGYKVDPRRWTADPTVARDIERSFKEMHELRDKLRAYNIEIPDLPKIPVKPEGFTPPGIELSDAAALGKAAGDIDATIQQVTGHLKAKDGPSAVAEIRALQARIHGTPGLEDLRLPHVAEPAVPPVDIDPVRLPRSIREFAKMRADNPKLEKLAKAAETNPEFASALERLAADLGVEASGGVRAIHKALNNHVVLAEKTAGSLKDAAAGKKGWSLLDLLRKKSKQGLIQGAARAADTGGWKGAMARSLVGGGVGYAAGGAEWGLMGATMGAGGGATGATLTAAKMGARSKIRGLVAKMAEGRPAALGKGLRPVLSYLHEPLVMDPAEGVSDWVTGEGDSRKAAVARIGEILRLQHTARDTMYSALEPLMGEPGDIAFKIHAQTVNALQHLAQTLPRDPGIDITPTGSNWSPSHEKTHEIAARIEAIKDPQSSLARVMSGKGHYAATETLWACYPAWMSEVASAVMDAVPSMNLTYEEGSMLSKIFRVPMTGLQHQAVVTTIQGLYLPKPQQPQAGGGSSSPNPGGRPAAVQSPVAGSSVAALTQ